MANIRHFRELRVWQLAMDAAMRIFEISKRFPVEERYSLTDQIRKSSRSVPANIAEAWRKRRYPAAWVSKLNDAEGESAETQTWTEIAVRAHYMSAAEARELDATYESILSQLTVMADHPEHWTIRATTSVVPASPRLRVPASVRRTCPSQRKMP